MKKERGTNEIIKGGGFVGDKRMNDVGTKWKIFMTKCIRDK